MRPRFSIEYQLNAVFRIHCLQWNLFTYPDLLDLLKLFKTVSIVEVESSIKVTYEKQEC